MSLFLLAEKSSSLFALFYQASWYSLSWIEDYHQCIGLASGLGIVHGYSSYSLPVNCLEIDSNNSTLGLDYNFDSVDIQASYED